MSNNSETLTHFYLITSKTLNLVVKGVLDIFLGVFASFVSTISDSDPILKVI